MVAAPAQRGQVDNKERAQRARHILDDPVVKQALREMEQRAIEDFVVSTRWWWGDRRRRIAAEHIREVRDFKHRLEVMLLNAPAERIKSTY